MTTSTQEPTPNSPEKKNRSVEDGPVLRDHTYDGIQEYDQKLPNWWLFTLYITIVFFVLYWLLYYHTPWIRGDAPRLDDQLEVVAEKKQERLREQMASLDDDVLWGMSRDASVVSAGKDVYTTSCVLCHGPDLSGEKDGLKLPGLPLNDEEWKYGGMPMEVMKLVTDGSPDVNSGMIAWKTQLDPQKIVEAVSYVLSHHEPPAAAN